MDRTAKIFLTGASGLVGSALKRKLEDKQFSNILCYNRKDLDLREQEAVERFFAAEKPLYVFLAAAKVGGINANITYPGEFIYDNLMIQTNVIHASYQYGVKKLLFLGSSCIYPKLAPQPIKEEYLLTGLLEPTNEPYAVAKIAGIKLCQAYNKQFGTDFIVVMPTNLYGPNDNFNLETSHVIPALIRKFYEAKLNNLPAVDLWGTGSPRREFLYVDDLAEACLFLMENYFEKEIINIGVGEDISIQDLALLIKKIVGFTGLIRWNPLMPDGSPRKLLDVSKINNLGWKAKISLEEGISQTYNWYLKNRASFECLNNMK